MELKWLEDFMELAATRNFSAAAAARHITQPAFSRRIRALENWIGTALIDRSSYPIKLTGAGETFLEASRDLMRDAYRLRDECRQQSSGGLEVVSFSAFHTIALSVFPDLLVDIEQRSGQFITRMHATDFYDCVESLTLGRCDIAFCYAHEFGPPVSPTGQFLSKTIGFDPFCLVSHLPGDKLFAISAAGAKSASDISLISYSSDCFLSKIQAHMMHELRKKKGITFRTVYENTMSEAVKRMVMAGKGVGWLPRSAARREIEEDKLFVIEEGSAPVDLSILAIRKQGSASAAAERFWANLPDESARKPTANAARTPREGVFETS